MRSLLLLAVLLAPLAQAADVHLVGGAYQPSVVHARPGEAITFVNDDDVPHTVTSAWDGGATFSRVLRPGESVAITFQQPGAYAVRCVPHSASDGNGGYSGMVATVEVAAPAGPRTGLSLLPLVYAGLALTAAALLAWQGRRLRPMR